MKTHGDVDKQYVLYGPIVQDLAQVRNELQNFLLNGHMFTLERVVYQRHDV